MARKEVEAAKSSSDYAEEAVRYYRNAREILRSVAIRDNRYTDTKYVREACGTAYLAVLAAARSFLLSQGVPFHKLPESYDAYGQALARFSARNGKTKSEFAEAYAALHLDGYCRGFQSVVTGEEAFARAQFLIRRLTGRSVE